MKKNQLNQLFKSGFNLKIIMPILLILVMTSCSNHMPTNPLNPIPDILHNEYSLDNDIQYRNRPWYNIGSPVGLEPIYTHDDNGVIVSQVDGQWYYHPWPILAWGLVYLSSYELSSDTSYLHLARKYSDRLMILGNRFHNSIYIPYEFNHILHGGSFHDAMMAPWYSGLAQGMALCFYSRFYELTGDPYYRNIADSIFQCYLYTDTSNDVWTSRIDSANYYWVEEYPFNPPDQVLNGFQTAIICLYDYYHISHNPAAKTIFEAGCTTLEHYFNYWRCPGGISYYCLRHRMQLESYHSLHITQFEYLYMITSDSSFIWLADTLRSDYP
jgi:hypothetical protein